MTGSNGYCAVAANQAGNSQYLPAPTATETVTLYAPNRIAPTVTLTGAPSNAYYGSTFTVSTTQNSGVTPVITAAPTQVCTISGNTVTMVSGTDVCFVTASWAGDASYLAATLYQTTEAAPQVPTLSWTPPVLAYGPLGAAMNATASVQGKFIYYDGTAQLSSNLVLLAGNYTLSATFTPALSKDYAGGTVTAPLTVNQAVPVTTVTSPSAKITLNKNTGHASTTPAFNVTSYKPTGTVTLSTGGSGPSCAATITPTTGSGSCTLTFNTAGTYTVTASYSGDSNHTASSNSTQNPPVTVAVNQ
jgi:hypothetical protein